MKYVYFAVSGVAGVIWVSALVCVVVALFRAEDLPELLRWTTLAVLACASGRVAGSLLEGKKCQHDKKKKDE